MKFFNQRTLAVALKWITRKFSVERCFQRSGHLMSLVFERREIRPSLYIPPRDTYNFYQFLCPPFRVSLSICSKWDALLIINFKHAFPCSPLKPMFSSFFSESFFSLPSITGSIGVQWICRKTWCFDKKEPRERALGSHIHNILFIRIY